MRETNSYNSAQNGDIYMRQLKTKRRQQPRCNHTNKHYYKWRTPFAFILHKTKKTHDPIEICFYTSTGNGNPTD